MKKILYILAFFTFVFLADTGGALFENCMSCHNFDTGTPPGIYPAINTSFFGVHRDINITDGVGILSDVDCSVCHYDVSKMFSSGFTAATYKCEDCHINGVIQGAPKVYNHTRNANISVNASCIDCHSKTADLFKYNSNASSAHYGRNASFGIATGEAYCVYCHRNSSTIYNDVMRNQNNAHINDHTTGIINPGHPAGRPDCPACHGQDKLHGSNISKPVLNSSFCENCHRNDQIKKNMHNGKVECINCHTEMQSDIHNIKYVMQDGSFRGINATGCGDCHDSNFNFKPPISAANCATCHQGNGLPGFATAPKIPTPVKHSANPYNGSLWNGSQPAYWTSQQAACNYCHGNTIHESKALGDIEYISSGNLPGQVITNTSYWCANCHYKDTPAGNYSYNASAFSPVPPEIKNNTGMVPQNARDGMLFFNHSLQGWSDNTCKLCHSTDSPNFSTQFVHNVSAGGGGAGCISCHNVNGTGAPADKRVDILAFEKGVHKNLNDGGNRACWACHGDGTEPAGHPAQYRSPRKCSDDNCHSLSQSYSASMVYSHFRNASLNGNPGNVLNSNVTTQKSCEECHAGSATAVGNNLYSTASHYASPELPDSRNCIFCHLNKDNSEKWGSATLINRNSTSLVELDRVRNKFTLKTGQSAGLGAGFELKLLDVSNDRTALIELFKNGISVDRNAAGPGNYTYDETLSIDNSSVKVPVIVLNLTGFFNSGNNSFIQFEGFRQKRLHNEDKTTSCYLCHVYPSQKIKYRVLERVDRNIDDIFYTEELVNFTDEKEYNETDALRVIANLSDTDRHVDTASGGRKVVFEGEAWNISRDYSLLVKETTMESDEAYMVLRAGNFSFENIINKGEFFEYAPAIDFQGYESKNITIFRAKVSEIIQAKPRNMVVLEEVLALSPDIKKIEENQTIEGYNASWLRKNSTLTTGKIPSNLHSPALFDGINGGGDCLSCHGNDGFSEKKIISLGKHVALNGGGNNACYVCHGGREGIKEHPAGYRSPRECKSCHAATIDNYSAVYIGDEEHKNEKCDDCHVSGSHNIISFDVIPSVKKISVVKQNNGTILKAFATAGYKMRVRAARFYIDSPAEKTDMSPVDGVFDSQVEEVSAKINVTKISPGKHVIYIESMERNDKWGTPVSLPFEHNGEELKISEGSDPVPGLLLGGFALVLIIMRWLPEHWNLISQHAKKKRLT